MPIVNRLEANDVNQTAVARSTGLSAFGTFVPGVPLRFTPGFMLTPAPQAKGSDKLKFVELQIGPVDDFETLH
jgi:hypothetical protein